MPITRRDFLRSASAVAAGAAIPSALSGAFDGPRQRKLLVVELNGGNDALNTLIPVTSRPYYAQRPTLAIPRARALMLNQHVGLHPAMVEMHAMWRAGQLAIIQGVGYPNPSRSHFRAMEIYHRGQVTPEVTGGWLAGHAGPGRAVFCGGEMPEMFRGGAAHDTGAPVSLASSVQSILPEAPAGRYPQGEFGQSLAGCARMIVRNAPARLFHVTLGGFDTHARQAETHARLLGALSAGLGAFFDDLRAHGRDGQVLVMVFSEFGRRLRENSSAGTDHGSAGVMFFAGPAVRGGLYGRYPSLTDLEDGELKFTTDFRTCYQAVLSKWLGGGKAGARVQFA